MTFEVIFIDAFPFKIIFNFYWKFDSIVKSNTLGKKISVAHFNCYNQLDENKCNDAYMQKIWVT